MSLQEWQLKDGVPPGDLLKDASADAVKRMTAHVLETVHSALLKDPTLACAAVHVATFTPGLRSVTRTALTMQGYDIDERDDEWFVGGWKKADLAKTAKKDGPYR